MIRRAVILISLSFVALIQCLNAQTTAFNYQGRLTDVGNPANGAFQMQFKLFDSLGGAGQVGSTITNVPVTVNQGTFSVKLDFGSSALSGANRWLEIAVRRNSGESYVTLAPREQIASSPYAVRTLSASTADNALNLGGVPASDYLTNASAGSNFIRNGANLQTASFNISGNGFLGGNLGIGMTNPTSRIEIAAQDGLAITGFQPFMTLRDTGSGGARSIFAGGNGDFGFYPNSFIGGVPAVIVKNITGNVGIGVANPAARLDLRGTGLGAQQRITDSVSGNSLVFQSGAGADMKVTGYNFNSGQPVPLNLSVDGANLGIGGNVVQTRDKGGTVKAMVYVNGNGSIIRCYNGLTGASSGTCGFSASRVNPGRFSVDFNFQVHDRFISVSVNDIPSVQNNAGASVSFGFNPADPNDVLDVSTYQINAGPSDRPFMVIVY